MTSVYVTQKITRLWALAHTHPPSRQPERLGAAAEWAEHSLSVWPIVWGTPPPEAHIPDSFPHPLHAEQKWGLEGIHYVYVCLCFNHEKYLHHAVLRANCLQDFLQHPQLKLTPSDCQQWFTDCILYCDWWAWNSNVLTYRSVDKNVFTLF